MSDINSRTLAIVEYSILRHKKRLENCRQKPMPRTTMMRTDREELRPMLKKKYSKIVKLQKPITTVYKKIDIDELMGIKRKPVDEEVDKTYRVLHEPPKAPQPSPTEEDMILEATKQKTPRKRMSPNSEDLIKNQRWNATVKPRSPLNLIPYTALFSRRSMKGLTDSEKLMIKSYRGNSHTKFNDPCRMVDTKTSENNLLMNEKLLNVKSSLSISTLNR